MPDVLHPGETEQDEVEDVPVDPGDFAVAMTADDQMEADLLLDACGEAGIAAILQSARSGPVGTIASPVEAFSILVPRRDLDRAVQLLAQRRKDLEADPEGAARAAEEEEAETERG